MFGSIGGPELIVILALALLIFGPKKLPEVGRSIGKALREFRRTSDELKDKIEQEIQAEEFKEIKQDFDAVTDFKSTDFTGPPENPYESPDVPSDPSPQDAGQDTPKDTKQDEEGK